MHQLPAVLWGAALPLATAYALGTICFRALPLPAVVRLGLGAVVESLLIFGLFLMGWGSTTAFLVGGLACVSTLIFLRPARLKEPAAQPLDTLSRWLFLPVLAIYFVLYLVHAMAPEFQADAIAYHLGLPAEYLRLGGFPHRVGFYEVLPQGMEMLFAAGYAFGRHSSARLIHFFFLAGSVPLMVLVCRRLKFTDAVGYAAAVLYIAAPVVGISGTSAYTDAALVFYHLAAFYLLLLWRDEGFLPDKDLGPDKAPLGYVFAAGMAAGFCFAVKFTGLLATPLALLFILVVHRRVVPGKLKDLVALTAGAALIILPWMLRDLILTGNPLAPLFNNWFPNAFFSAAAEQTLSQTVRNYGGFRWFTAPWEWAFGGRLQGVAGPLIFLLPIAILAWRKPLTRLVLLAGLLLLAPAFYNVGTRFLMPALPFLAIALISAIPRPVALCFVLLQAILCFPPVLACISPPQTWTLRGFPWQAALRIQPEAQYLEATTGDYAVARMIESNTSASSRIFGLVGLPNAYIARESLEFWHSALAIQLTDSLRSALRQPPVVRIQADWPPVGLEALRVVSTSNSTQEWRIFEMRLFSPDGPVPPSAQWSLAAFPNLWEAPRAFDGNRTTAWSSRAPEARGMFLEVEFGKPAIKPEMLSSIELLTERTKPVENLIVQGRAPGAKWRLLADGLRSTPVDKEDLRREAIRALKAAGFTHILVGDQGGGTATLGKDMALHPIAWGVQDIAQVGPVHLFRIL